MTEWNDQIVILRLGYFHEADVWLRVLSKKSGIQTVFAFGGARSLHRFCGCLDIFNTLDCRIKSSRSGAYLNLEEASILEAPRRLRKDWRRMGLAVNCMRFLELNPITGEEAEKAFLLLENLRFVLEKAPNVSSSFSQFFRLAISTISGFAPDFQICGNCGKMLETGGYFFLNEGRIICPQCKDKQKGIQMGQYVSPNAIHTLTLVQRNLPEKWPQLELSLSERTACARLINDFIEKHMGIEFGEQGFKRLDYLKQAVQA